MTLLHSKFFWYISIKNTNLSLYNNKPLSHLVKTIMYWHQIIRMKTLGKKVQQSLFRYNVDFQVWCGLCLSHLFSTHGKLFFRPDSVSVFPSEPHSFGPKESFSIYGPLWGGISWVHKKVEFPEGKRHFCKLNEQETLKKSQGLFLFLQNSVVLQRKIKKHNWSKQVSIIQ